MHNFEYMKGASAIVNRFTESERGNASRSYVWHRANGELPCDAIMRAMQDTMNGKRRYPELRGALIGGDASNETRWIEYPERGGFRFVGFADEVIEGRAIDHFGWYTDEFDGETLRGAVYQLPANNGQPRFIAAYRHGSYSRQKKRWTDVSGNPAALLDVRGIYETARDAAFPANSLAEHAAEKEREYQAAWQAGGRYRELLDSAKAMHNLARELIGELRDYASHNEGIAYPKICKMIRANIRKSLEQWRDDNRAAGDLRDEWEAPAPKAASNQWQARKRQLWEAFADGADITT
ncbi:hypothetical protein [Alterisphingorhabdus coralli]|uniref:Uncharacterized protein n=1 Tax=Alterisphingorhabdus coralli TaxID=3071408 RepID=A0AA97FA37_9SPHN|nr:hypothetical protein [Parasphingorhabdus sp. SCSIO 66989]WOE76356.1 hypothetical protein RB602_06485 [Parasphingorhabdus sp. SCSIO 66989]